MNIDKIVCIGKNYSDHIREMNDAPIEKPVIFLKPPSVLLQAKNWHETAFAHFPINCGEVHPECEVVLRVAKGGFQLTREQAKSAIDAVTLGLDGTLRERQALLKKTGQPWTTAKVFRDAAIIGPWIPINEFKHYLEIEFTLTLDGAIKQRGRAATMLMQPIDILIYISEFFPLCPGDIIFTGTPAGVSAISPTSKATLSWGDYQYQVQWR